MNEKIQRNFFNYLVRNDVKNFVGVPDSTMKHFIDEGLCQKKILIATREEEAIGIATGFTLSKSYSLVYMQNAGFGNSISAITSLVQLYKIPIIFLSAMAQKDDFETGIDIGADAYISKPFEPTILLAKIESLLRK